MGERLHPSRPFGSNASTARAPVARKYACVLLLTAHYIHFAWVRTLITGIGPVPEIGLILNKRRENEGVTKKRVARGTQGRVLTGSGISRGHSMSPREPVSKASKQDMALEECGAGARVDVAAMNRALELLARWALRCGQKALEDVGIDHENRVTGDETKGYDGRNGGIDLIGGGNRGNMGVVSSWAFNTGWWS